MRLVEKRFLETESTLDLAKKFSGELSPGDLYVYTAEKQTKARGSHSRAWVAPPNVNIYATYSFLLKKTESSPVLVFFPLVAGYSVIRLLKYYHLPAKLKWPNDVLVKGKKITGILCESSDLKKNKIIYKIINIGIGINVNMDPKNFEQINQPATSMFQETGRFFIKEEVQKKLNELIREDIQLLVNDGFQYFYEKISAVIENFNNQIIFFDPQEKGDEKRFLKGTVKGISIDGRLILNSVYQHPQSPKEAQYEDKLFINGRIIRTNENYNDTESR